jgi:hypothetical protein
MGIEFKQLQNILKALQFLHLFLSINLFWILMKKVISTHLRIHLITNISVLSTMPSSNVTFASPNSQEDFLYANSI